jgi:hypothetical protein
MKPRITSSFVDRLVLRFTTVPKGFSHSAKYRSPQAFQHRLARCVAQSGRVPKRVVSILRGHGSGELSAKVALTLSSPPLQVRVEDGTLVLYYSFHVHYQRVQSGPDEIAPILRMCLAKPQRICRARDNACFQQVRLRQTHTSICKWNVLFSHENCGIHALGASPDYLRVCILPAA